MKQQKGGAAGSTRTKRAEHQRDIVEYVRDAIECGHHKTKTPVYDAAAQRFNTTTKYVKTLYTGWIRAGKKRILLDQWRPVTRKR